MLVSAGISRQLDTCLSGIHNANNIVNSIVYAVILVRGSRVPAYRIRLMHGPIHILHMHGTGTKHIVRHTQKSVVQWSGVAEFTCIFIYIQNIILVFTSMTHPMNPCTLPSVGEMVCSSWFTPPRYRGSFRFNPLVVPGETPGEKKRN